MNRIMNRRHATLSSISLLASGSWAQSTLLHFPSRPISLVVPYAAGGVTDVVARMIATPLSKRLSQSVVVENVTGAGGNIGAQKVSGSDPTGYTLLLSQTSLVTNPLLNPAVKLDSVSDFTHISFVGSLPLWLLVNPSRPGPQSLEALIQEARSTPGKLNYGSGGTGSASHLGVAYLEKLEGIQTTHIPYRGMSAAISDLLARNVQFCLTPVAGTESLVTSGRLKALAVTSSERLNGFPEVPTFQQSGISAMDVAGWIGISGPKSLPEEVVSRINSAVQSVLSEPQISNDLADRTLQTKRLTPAQFASYVAKEKSRWKPLIDANGIRME